MRIGVLAIQGDVSEHAEHLRKIAVDAVYVRTTADLQQTDGLIIPGGESTTIGLLMQEAGLIDAIRTRVQQHGYPVYGTCAGLILLASEVEGKSPARLSLMDMTAARNAYGRQLASFEADISLEILGSRPFPAVFIRAPKIVRIGPQVKVLATYQDHPVMAEQGSLLVSSFHPEMSDDVRIHRYFVDKVRAHLLTT
ncbi:MAG: pyridoxal 5'-phosphate synthase glutaminase subunit PdxT [Firmicutes bacterium]|nr:pyridoxal 5'-phosphate synthase glutaminase subunit PdxT [Bacillota bacterium]